MNPFGATVSPTAGAPPPGFGAPAQAAPPAAYGPPPGYGAAPAPYAPPPAAPYAPPPAAPYAPPPAYQQPPAAPTYQQPPAAPVYQQPPGPVQPQWSPQGAPVAVPTQSRASAPSGPHSHDPSAFAATSPPPTSDEHEAQIRRSQAPVGPSPSAPPNARSAPPPPAAAPAAVALGPGRDPELIEAGAIRALAGFLVSYDQNEFGVFWPLYQGQNVLGRKGASAGLDIEIDSPTTSSRHAIVYASARPGRLKVEDVGSTNGTFMNDAPIERSKKFELRDNDILRFGGFSVTVKII